MLFDPMPISELREKYEKTPRKLDSYLRPLTAVETTDRKPFPWGWISLSTAILTAAAFGLSYATGGAWQMILMLMLPVMLGVGIQIARSASPNAYTGRLLKTAKMTEGRVIKAHGRLYQVSDTPEEAVVVFATDGEARFDRKSVRDAAKIVRSAAESNDAPADMAAVVEAVNGQGQPAPVPGHPGFWVGRVLVNPRRLPEEKIVDQAVPLLVDPEKNLVAHL